MKQSIVVTCGMLAIGVAGLPAVADAEDGLSYTWLEADYVNLNVDIYDDEDFLESIDDGGGWAVRGSVAFSPNMFGFANYSVTESDATFIDNSDMLIFSTQDVKRLDAGIGFNFPILVSDSAQTDVFTRAAYTDVDFDDFNLGGTSDPDIDDLNEDGSDGFFVDGGLRTQLSDRLEGSIGARYTDIEDVDDVSVIGNLMFELTPAFGINLTVDAGENVSTYMAGVRWSFMPR